MSFVGSVFRQGLFNGKTAIVTGGGTGIGKAISTELLDLGCNVIIASRKEDRLKETEEFLRTKYEHKSSGSISSFVCNVRKEDQIQRLIETTINRYGGVDFLVNNGGGQFVSYASDITRKGWDAVVETNLTGTFLMCQQIFKQWMKENGGNIVNITMDHGRGFPMMAHSAAARAGVENLTKSLAVEWAEFGIRINCVAPGNAIHSKTAVANYSDDAIFEHARVNNPAKRLGSPEEVSSAVCFLLSPGASFISGINLLVDSGSTLYKDGGIPIPEHKNLLEYKWNDNEK